jgi:hypothetical protein
VRSCGGKALISYTCGFEALIVSESGYSSWISELRIKFDTDRDEVKIWKCIGLFWRGCASEIRGGGGDRNEQAVSYSDH